jgi:hypothetical protein
VTRYTERVVFSTDDSAVPVSITYPAPLNAQEIADLEEFFVIWIRSQKRRTKPAGKPLSREIESALDDCARVAGYAPSGEVKS